MFSALRITISEMFFDRSKLRDDYPRERTSVLVWLICAIVAGFILQFLLGSARVLGAQSLTGALGLTIKSLKNGEVWTLFTHSFLHDKFFLPHIMANLLGLYFIGRELLPVLGERRFIGLYFGALLAGGLAWALTHWQTGGEYFGATAAVNALLVVFACFYPHRRMDFLLFFIFPISLKPKHLALGLLAFDAFGLIFQEIRGLSLPFGFNFAHSAHLGGMLAGWIYFRYLHDVPWQLATPQADLKLPSWLKQDPKPVETALPAQQVNISNPSDVRAEVDRILDKINSHGFSALSADEKRLLDEARDLLSRR